MTNLLVQDKDERISSFGVQRNQAGFARRRLDPPLSLSVKPEHSVLTQAKRKHFATVTSSNIEDISTNDIVSMSSRDQRIQQRERRKEAEEAQGKKEEEREKKDRKTSKVKRLVAVPDVPELSYPECPFVLPTATNSSDRHRKGNYLYVQEVFGERRRLAWPDSMESLLLHITEVYECDMEKCTIVLDGLRIYDVTPIDCLYTGCVLHLMRPPNNRRAGGKQFGDRKFIFVRNNETTDSQATALAYVLINKYKR